MCAVALIPIDCRYVLNEQDGAQPPAQHHDPALAWVKTRPPGPWVARAACAGMPTSAFVDTHSAAAVSWARGVCAGCPVSADCADYAVESKAFGVWGGQLFTSGKAQPRAG